MVKQRHKDEPELSDAVVASLEDAKAKDIVCLDVRHLTTMTDYMIIASGTSDRHVKSIAANLVDDMKESGHRPYGVEGQDDGEWVLVDLQDAIVHVMLPRVREFYNLEKLWDISAPKNAGVSD